MRLPLIAALVVGCSSLEPAPQAPEKPLVRIGGSETMTRALLPALTKVHLASKNTLRFEVSGGGTGAGIRQLLNGTLDIAAASRPHRPSDEEQAVVNGFSLDAHGARQIIGMDVVAVVVPEGSPIKSLTYDQVIGIFCDRTIDNMQFLGPDFPDMPLRPLARDPRSGTRALFEDFFCGPRGLHPKIEVVDTQGIEDALTKSQGVISFASMTERNGRLVPLMPVANAQPIIPSQRTIANGSYPLYHDLYVYTPGPPTGSAKAFVDWILSPAGQEIVDEHRFVPIYHRTKDFDGPRPLRETIHFDVGESYPNQRSIARIQLLVQELRERKSSTTRIVLEGYTDNTEDNALELSDRRANTVRELLEQQLQRPYFEIIARGPERPLAPNDTPYGRQRNRRVQIYLTDDLPPPDEPTKE